MTYRTILPATLAMAVAAVTAGCMTKAETQASAGDPDARFLVEAAHSSTAELTLSQVALERATDPQVKQFAQMMVRDHQTQNQSLKDLAMQKGMPAPARPDELHAKAAASMRAMPAGRQFDAEYMSTMVADHARTLSMLQDKAAMASDPQVRAWAGQQVPIIQMHLEQARQISSRLGGRSTVGSGATAAGGSGSGGGAAGTMGGMSH